MSLNAYHRARRVVETPRATECRLMRQITGEMIEARDAGLAGVPLTPILFRNREVWSAFAAACAARGNMLPIPLRAAIVSLGLWVERYTTEVAAGRDRIDALIEINRLIIDGLQGESLPSAAHTLN